MGIRTVAPTLLSPRRLIRMAFAKFKAAFPKPWPSGVSLTTVQLTKSPNPSSSGPIRHAMTA